MSSFGENGRCEAVSLNIKHNGHDNNAENMLVLVDYRDSGGSYCRAGEVDPAIMQVVGDGTPYSDEYNYVIPCEKPNAVVL